MRVALLVSAASLLAGALAGAEEPSPCVTGATLATGAPDPTIFGRDASRGVRGFWCESYDADGSADRAGAYWDTYPDGSTRTLARYVDSRLEGPIEVFDEEGRLWLRGELQAGEWTGPLEIFHANGGLWLTARFQAGRLDGEVETRFPDGRLESRTRFQEGREDGTAISYYPLAAGGGLRSRVQVEGDAIVEHASIHSPAEPDPSAAPRLEAARDPADASTRAPADGSTPGLRRSLVTTSPSSASPPAAPLSDSSD